MSRVARAAVFGEVAWRRGAQGYFKIGRSKIGGTDGLAPVAFGDAFAGTFEALPVSTISIPQRGLRSPGGVQRAAEAQVVVRDPTGIYNAKNPSSPLAGLLRPLRPLRLYAVGPGYQHATVSGNEITDALRALGVQGDGLAVPAGFGIWPAATNYLTNGGFETNTTSWASDAFFGGTVVYTREPVHPKFGSYAGRLTTTGRWLAVQTSSGLSAVVGTDYTASIWVYADAAAVGKRLTVETLQDGFLSAAVEYTLVAGPQRLKGGKLTPVAGAGASLSLRLQDARSEIPSNSLWLDGAQFEVGAVATPYIHTDGAPATRAAALVTAPPPLISETQSWMALRWRYGFTYTAGLTLPSGNPQLARLDDVAAQRVQLVLALGGATPNIRIARVSTGGLDLLDVPIPAFTEGEEAFALFDWTATEIAVRYNGGPRTALASPHIPPPLTNFALGSTPAGAQQLCGNLRWVTCGTGTPTGADAEFLRSCGNTPPQFRDLPAAAQPTAKFPFVDERYIVPSQRADLFFGFLRDGEARPTARKGTATFDCVDLLVWLERAKPVIASTGPTTVGAAIGLVLDAIGWTDPTMRDLDDGSDIPDFAADGTLDGTQLLAGLLAVDLGRFYPAKSGVATYRARNSWVGQQITTLAGEIRDLGSAFTLDTIVNRATRTKTGSTPQTYVDQESADEYGYDDAEPLDSGYFVSDAAALSHAAYTVTQNKDPRDPIYSITLRNSSDEALAQILTLEQGDLITSAEPVMGTEAAEQQIEQLSFALAERGAITGSYLARDLPTKTPLKIGSGRIGDALTY